MSESISTEIPRERASAGFDVQIDKLREIINDVLVAHHVLPNKELVDELAARSVAAIDAAVTVANGFNYGLQRQRGTDV